jgi:hypothetical protein
VEAIALAKGFNVQGSRTKQAKPDDFVDVCFVQQLDESAYVNQLYGRQ